MIRRLSLVTVAAFVAVALVSAFADVTFVLKNGQRHSGQLTYHTGVGDLGVTVNGRERMFPFDEIAVIQFTSGNPSKDELEKLPTSDNPPERERHMLVLKNGEVIHGKYHGFEGDQMSFDVWNSNGNVDRRAMNLGDVARLYVSATGARNVFNNILNNNASASNTGARFGRGGRRSEDGGVEVRVEANRAWTDTGLIVNQGDRVRFVASDQVKIDPQITTGPDGSASLARRSSYPIPDMPVGGLIGRVGNGPPFAIGSRTSPVTMPATGRLYLGVNDDKFTDNSGGFTVKVQR
jgi:hypothetical protein